jgi:hypothetical protein
MLVTESGIAIDIRLVHPSKTLVPKDVTELPKTTELNFAQCEKLPAGMCGTPSGIVIDSSRVHPKKADPTMLVVESESTKDVIFDPSHTPDGTVVTESGMTTDVVVQPVKALSEILTIVSAITIAPLVLHGTQRTSTPRG